MRKLILAAFPVLVFSFHTPGESSDFSYLEKYQTTDQTVKTFLRDKDIAFEELNLREVFQAVDRTNTVFGKLELKSLLEPISDIQQLNQRRSVIEFLLENPEIFESLKTNLQDFRIQHESNLLHFLSPKGRLYFHEDPSMLGNTKTSSVYQLGLQGFTTLLITQGLAYEGFQAYQNYRVVRNASHRGWFRGFVGYNLIGQVGGVAFAFYITTKNTLQTLQKISAADLKVVNAAKAYTHLRKTLQLLERIPLLKEKSAPQTLSQNLKFEHLLATLDSRLAASTSWTGHISSLFSLDIYDELCDSAPQIAKELQILGLADAFLSVAILYKEYEYEGRPVTLATFNREDKSGFEFRELRNLIVEKPVSNDVETKGKTQSQHIVLTGPHGCGKTTFMKSIAHAILLGQSILLVPARFAHFVPITNINTYFNIGDNIVLGLSSFMAEHQRMAQLKTISDTLDPQSNVLMLIDEPYAKTIQAVGEPRVTSFLSSVIGIQNLSVILATHFEAPAGLEFETNGIIKNLQPEIDAEMKPTYKIIPGASDWWFKNDTQRELFIQRLIDGR